MPKPDQETGNKSSLSILVPVFDEEGGLEELHNRVSYAVDELDLEIEILYVNDGSRDRSAFELQKIADGDPRVSLLHLSRNYGKEIALTAGLDKVAGDAVIILDADLQDPPELIPEFVRLWQEEGYDNVYGQRTRRDGETWLKKATAFAFYRVMKRLSDVDVPSDTGDFRLLSRRAIEAVTSSREQHRFMKGLFAWIGFPSVAVPYVREARHAGQTKWNYWKLFGFAVEGITAHSLLPLRLASVAGLAIASLSFLYGSFIVAKTLILGVDVPGYASLMAVFLFLGGVQLLSLGLIGEYVGRIYNEAKGRPLYFEQHFHPSALADQAATGQELKVKAS